jgi:hypothetical protein
MDSMRAKTIRGKGGTVKNIKLSWTHCVATLKALAANSRNSLKVKEVGDAGGAT